MNFSRSLARICLAVVVLLAGAACAPVATPVPVPGAMPTLAPNDMPPGIEETVQAVPVPPQRDTRPNWPVTLKGGEEITIYNATKQVWGVIQNHQGSLVANQTTREGVILGSLGEEAAVLRMDGQEWWTITLYSEWALMKGPRAIVLPK